MPEDIEIQKRKKLKEIEYKIYINAFIQDNYYLLFFNE